MDRLKNVMQLLGLIIIVFVLVFALDYALPEQPLQGQGNCKAGAVAKDESAPFEYDGTQIITKVIIKSGQECISFKANGTDGCYWVMGIGTTHVKVSRVGNPSPECQEVSHVEFYAEPQEDTATPVSTATRETPFKFWTFTPTSTVATATQTVTATPPMETPTLTVSPTGQTGTPTEATNTPPEPTGTNTSPPRHRTATPQVLLPQTGEDGGGSAGNSGVGIVFPAVFLGLIVLFFVIRLMSKGKGGTSL